MRLFFVAIMLITIVTTYFLLAGVQLYTLKSENDEFTDVTTWIKAKDQLLPVSRTHIHAKKLNIDLSEAQYFYFVKDRGFGTKQIIQNQPDPLIKINWYNQNGQPTGMWHMPWYNDSPLPIIRIDHQTKNLICVDLQNQIRIINPEGNLSKQFKILESYDFNSENNVYVDLNNGFLCVGINEISSSSHDKPKYKSSIRVYELDGSLHMGFDFPEWQIRSLTGSSTGKLIAVSFFKNQPEQSSYQFRSVVMDMEENILVDYPVRTRKAIFNHDNSMIYFMDKNLGYLFRIQGNRLITKTKVKNGENIYLSALFIPSAKFLVTQEGKVKQEIVDGQLSWIYNDIRIISRDNQGREKYDLPVGKITIDKPTLWYDSESKEIFVGHRQGWKIFRVNH